ncbi:hypothetical protein [Aeromicrobium fastidiosum]|uniref:Uncharacterized protein n=1 Tax=Aeromicrobium fastidiosum TaxID=52699 RepID=A0A641ARA4_9ACTN|nr:hypothetical protein [Aeromicrobium fastidiosum]KAA1380222.1 hypothetical protein ESP62_003230 [Aeromicrobium fastidiosum]MBP2389772.1 hypothetical protein [Aeromicrobium fastidiosum]
MRKIFVLLAAAVVVLGLFSPAEAARKKSFGVSLSPTPSGTQKTYNDTSLDLSSAHGEAHGRTTIRGRVKGGKVVGKKVQVYATNMHSASRTRTSLGSARIGKGGVFTKAFKPANGHAGTYKIEVVKSAGGGRKAKVKTFSIRVYEWVSLSSFYQPAASTGSVTVADKEQTGSGTNPNERWSTAYALTGDSTAVFSFAGYRCMRFNLKLALSQVSRVGDASYQVSQPGRGIMAGALTKGGAYAEPTRAQSENIDPNAPFTVSVTDAEAGADARTILGLPKVACMWPYKVAAAPY